MELIYEKHIQIIIDVPEEFVDELDDMSCNDKDSAFNIILDIVDGVNNEFTISNIHTREVIEVLDEYEQSIINLKR